jgi:hypothetical protein
LINFGDATLRDPDDGCFSFVIKIKEKTGANQSKVEIKTNGAGKRGQ